MAPRLNPMTVSRLVPPTPASLPTAAVALQPTPVDRKGKNGVAMMPRLFDVSCDETLCSADSFCVNDYTWGGSRCHCNLGKGGESCSEGRCLGETGGGLTLQEAREQYCSPHKVPSCPFPKISPFFHVLVIKLAS